MCTKPDRGIATQFRPKMAQDYAGLRFALKCVEACQVTPVEIKHTTDYCVYANIYIICEVISLGRICFVVTILSWYIL